MPVLVDAERCPCGTPCFPSKMCPYDVLHFDFSDRTQAATLDPTLCGECKGICTNFCDPRALRFAPTMAELQILEAELTGAMTAAQAAVERKRIKEEEARKKQAQIVEVKTAAFEQEVLKAELPVVLDCWAPWCGPCKTFAPVFAQAALEHVGKLKFCKLNTDDEPQIAQALRIQSIPTLVFFYQGQVLGAIPGAMTAAQLRSTIEQVLRSVASMPQKPTSPAQPTQPSLTPSSPTSSSPAPVLIRSDAPDQAPKPPRGRLR